MTYFAYPYCGTWAVAYRIPGTDVLSIWMVCRSLAAAQHLSTQLNSERAKAA